MNYPNQLDDKNSLFEVKDLGKTSTSKPLNAVELEIEIDNPINFPTGRHIVVVESEVIIISHRIDNILYVEKRGAFDTLSENHITNSKIGVVFTSAHYETLRDSIIDIQKELWTYRKPVNDVLNDPQTIIPVENESYLVGLSPLNEFIGKNLGEDYKLGHSYFMQNMDLEFVKEYKIKPLLEEYFYGDEENYKKIESSDDQFDIFLSHSYQDKEIIPHLKKTLENLGFRVYVDWINDKFLSRENVDKKTATLLQKRMSQSRSLFYATSQNSKNSKWMPWELGYFDGIKNKRVAILPIDKGNTSNENFEGQEYLGLYFYVSIDMLIRDFFHKYMLMEPNYLKELLEQVKHIPKLFINENNNKFVLFEEWLEGGEPYTLENEYDMIMKEIKEWIIIKI